MSVAEAITNRVKHMPKGKPFAVEHFIEAGPRSAVDKALSRLVEQGTLERVVRGVYMRPKVHSIIGKIEPSAETVVKVIAAAKGEVLQTHGAEAVRAFRISTQMQTVLTFYTSGTTREIRVGESVVHLRHVSKDRLQHAGTPAGLALSALYYLGKEGVTQKTVRAITSRLPMEQLKKLFNSKMPAWMKQALAQAQSLT